MAGDSSVLLNGVSVAGGQSSATFLDSGNLQHVKVILEVQNGGSDPAKISTGNPLPVVAASLPLPTGAALDSSVNGLLIAQAAALGTNKGTLAMASCVTGTPSFTAGNIYPCTVDTEGALRVNVVEGSGGGGTSLTDNTTDARGGFSITPAGARVESTDPTLTAGNISAISLNPAGYLRVVAGGNVASGAADAGNPTKIGGVYHSTPVTLTDGNRVDLQTDVNGYVKVNVTNGITGGSSAVPSAALVSITPQASVSGGASRSSVRIVSTTNAVQTPKGSAGQVYYIYAYNGTGAVAYLHFYDVSGAITLGTTSDTDVFPIPYNSQGAGVVIPLPMPLAFTNKIAYAVTGGVGATDNTATGAAASTPIVVNLGLA